MKGPFPPWSLASLVVERKACGCAESTICVLMAGTGAAFTWGEWSGHAKVVASSGLSVHDLRFRWLAAGHDFTLS